MGVEEGCVSLPTWRKDEMLPSTLHLWFDTLNSNSLLMGYFAGPLKLKTRAYSTPVHLLLFPHKRNVHKHDLLDSHFSLPECLLVLSEL